MLPQKRREAEKQKSVGLDETSRELLEQNRDERDKMEAEIQELRRRNVSIHMRFSAHGHRMLLSTCFHSSKECI